MINSKSFIGILLIGLLCLTSTANAETVAFYAGKIVKNCDYDAAMMTPLSKSFSAQDLRTLRIAISIDDSVCNQTHDFLAGSGSKVTPKTSHQFVVHIYKIHKAAFKEAEAAD